jgi:hypothetical protein
MGIANNIVEIRKDFDVYGLIPGVSSKINQGIKIVEKHRM